MVTGVILICALSNLNVEGREVLEKCHVVRRILKVPVFQYFFCNGAYCLVAITGATALVSIM